MKKFLVAVLLMTATIVGFASPAHGNEDKVTICHRTNSNTNPYVKITVDKSAADGVAAKNGPADHYGEHQGPVWNPNLKAQKVEWGDIIPPIEGFHSGLNWTVEGQAIYNNGCKPVVPPTTTTTTVPEITTTTTVPDAGLIPPQVIERQPQAPTPVPVDELPRTGNNLFLAILGLGLVGVGYLIVRAVRT